MPTPQTDCSVFRSGLRFIKTLARKLHALLVATALWLVRFYQVAISPLHGPCCRFTPTCSQYCILAIRKYGLVVGLLKTVWRVLRCNPFGKGGYDPP